MTLLEKSLTLALFVASVISSAWWPTMPDWRWLLLGIIATGSIIKLRRGLLSIGVIWGFMVVIIHGNVMEHQRQALFRAGVNITINGKVDSPFTQISHGYEGIAQINQVNSQNLLPFLKPKIRLITAFPLPVNSEFTTQVTIKPILGLKNEAGFDAEKQAIGKGITARAVTPDDAKWLIRTHSSFRQQIITAVDTHISELDHFPLISALAFSDRSLLAKQDWQSLRDSGLLHLVSISGLHIGMAFAFGMSLGFVIRLLFPKFVHLPSAVGLLAALVYAWLADFSLPTTRAFSVCVIYLVLKAALVHWSPWRVLLLAVSIQLFIEPFASFTMSFWLSYLSVVAVLLAVNVVQQRRGNWQTKLSSLLKIQLVLTLLIVPISGAFFSGTSLVSIAYNLVFIPWFGFLVVPLMFLALIVTPISFQLAGMLWQLVDWVLLPLTWSLQFAVGSWHFVSLPLTLTILAVAICGLLRRFLNRGSFVTLVILVTGVALFYERITNSWRVDVLDVGHGLAVLIEKHGKVTLYDTGKAWNSGSIAQQVISPVLHRRGFGTIDMFIISHADSDHAGGRQYIEQHFSPAQKFSSQNYANYQSCIAGERWYWQALYFEVLWPPKQVNRAYNPHSCVVRVVDKESDFKLLLTGDIEAVSEWILMREPNKLESDVMLVPHHGSKSSSNPKFVQIVSPTLAIASLAKSNQWGMPAENVLSAYQEANAYWLDTGNHGQVSLFIERDNWYFEAKRSETFEPWYRQMLRKGVE
ncbi:DNA internalization-related competence protein ComEC/Rec2 [Vibrio campbellii]|uniref:DNA internalization-related competence protein ComEC/Rec2 n=1 Tax=Vibrio campbellii TaxID=680 RepID=UPI001D172825|nr:DNA internalization-related competence protein ComEC/Rec2 [Vibrio campbellii]MCC4224387.1 DNA internalization-related competence protein ComEC/Rec2 [Vibrio campbellii]